MRFFYGLWLHNCCIITFYFSQKPVLQRFQIFLTAGDGCTLYVGSGGSCVSLNFNVTKLSASKPKYNTLRVVFQYIKNGIFHNKRCLCWGHLSSYKWPQESSSCCPWANCCIQLIRRDYPYFYSQNNRGDVYLFLDFERPPTPYFDPPHLFFIWNQNFRFLRSMYY